MATRVNDTLHQIKWLGPYYFALKKADFQTTGSTDHALLRVIRRMEKTRNEVGEKRKGTREGSRKRRKKKMMKKKKRKKRASKNTSDKMPRETFFKILQLNHPISEY